MRKGQVLHRNDPKGIGVIRVEDGSEAYSVTVEQYEPGALAGRTGRHEVGTGPGPADPSRQAPGVNG